MEQNSSETPKITLMCDFCVLSVSFGRELVQPAASAREVIRPGVLEGLAP